MAATIVSFRWLDLLEKEFDKTFVDLDVGLFVGEAEDIEDGEWISHVRTKLGGLSSCFAQLAHKAQTIFQTNAKLEAELVNLRHELAEVGACQRILKEENHEMLMQLHASQLKFHKNFTVNDATDGDDTEKIQERLERELEEERCKRLSSEIPKEELVLLRRENETLKKHVLNLQGELSGSKLTAKYLDKELAGRIQQLQLLSRELNGEQHEKLWKQLEAEIHLHRHKTVVRACRTNNLQSPQSDCQNVANGGFLPLPAKPPRTQQHRFVTLHKGEVLGMSITGGREHGVPILISVLNNDLPAGACQQLFVGDAILSVNGHSLKDASHSEAVDILSSLEGKITLEVMFVSPDDDDEISGSLDDPLSFRYRMFDDEVASITSSLHLLQNGRLSRASIDSIRGSTDNILQSPRRLLEVSSDFGDDVSKPLSAEGDLGEAGDGSLDTESQAGVDDDSLSENSYCLEEAPPLMIPVGEEVECDGEHNKEEGIGDAPFKETSQLISSDNVERLDLDNQESLRLIDKVSATNTTYDEESLTSQDVFNSNY